MESQAVHSHGPGYEQDLNTVGLHSIVEGEDHGEHHHEKKSVLKKVKAKAKKLKDTITKHGHGHGDEGHVPDDHDLDEDDDEGDDEEMVEDPEVHGAPMYEFAAVRAAVPRSQEHGAGGFEESRDRKRTDYGGVMPMEEGVRAPDNTPQAAAPPKTTSRATDPTRTFVHEAGDRSKVNLTRPGGLEEDSAAPKDREELYSPSNYETKVADPTGSGGHEAKIAPLDQYFGALHIREETGTKPTQVSGTSTGSHDQFSPERVTKETEPLLGTGGPVPLREATTGGEGGLKDENQSSSPRSYTEKISSATSAATSVVADKEIAAKNILTSKLGYGTIPEDDLKESSGGDKSPDSRVGYTEKISSATHAIADKAALATHIVASKIGYGSKEEQKAHESSGVTEQPGDKPSEQSSYTGKIAAVAGTAKDVVASKLGYGSTEQKTGEGSAGETASAITHEKKVLGQDKGVSMRDYLAEKLKPGEEEKALSEVISSALNKQKKDTNKPVVITESEEVTRHLGEEGRGGEVQPSSPSRGVVDKLKGAVGSWLGKSRDPHSTQQSHGAGAIPSGADTKQEEHTGERRLQESTS